MSYDLVLIHPPAIYDFREKVIFPGPVTYTAHRSTGQFIIPPVGMLSIADYLDRNGYSVLVDNIGNRMVNNKHFDAEKHIGNLSAKVYGVGLHWCHHSQGAIEIARLCKKLHPDAMVVLGGLTATVFHEEVILKFSFIDAVIRGEAEKPFLLLMNALEKHKKLELVPNLTFRDSGGGIRSTPLMEPSVDLDEFEFTRLDLIEPKRSFCGLGWPPDWTIPILRGCSYNCVTCGGSKDIYKTYLGREKPALRSPEKVAEDIHKLNDQGVQHVFLCHDPRMGGKEYCNRLIASLRGGKFNLTHLCTELFYPASEEYIKELLKIGFASVNLTISPDSGAVSVRKAHGRNYSNEELFKTVEICKRYGIPLTIFSMIPLANDTPETIRENLEMEERIYIEGEGIGRVLYSLGPLILLEPGSLAFDFPKSYGYRLIFKNLEDYIRGMSLPSWHQWISYETKHLNRKLIATLIIDSIEHSLNLRERYGLLSSSQAEMGRFWLVTANKMVIGEVDQAMSLHDEGERLNKLKLFEESLYKSS
ncbi:radical SAM protein [Chloroflexota bacterium]